MLLLRNNKTFNSLILNYLCIILLSMLFCKCFFDLQFDLKIPTNNEIFFLILFPFSQTIDFRVANDNTTNKFSFCSSLLDNRAPRTVSLRSERSMSRGFPSLDLDTVVEEKSDPDQTQVMRLRFVESFDSKHSAAL